MKYQLIITLICLTASSCFAQWSTSVTNDAYNTNTSGKVGIGTSAPTSLLTLNKNGSGAQTSELRIQSNSVDVARFGWNASGYVDISSLYSNNHIVFSPTGSGNLGIGTTSPLARLTTSASETGTQVTTKPVGKFINVGNSYSKIVLGSDNANYDGVVSMDNSSILANTKLRLYIGNGTEATPGHSNDHFVLQGDGNVGIGTSAPTSLLTLNKNGSGAQTSELRIQSNSVDVARFGWNASGYVDISSLYSNNHIVFSPNGTGNLGIGTTSPLARLTTSASETGTQATTKPVGKFINVGNSYSKIVLGSNNANYDGVMSMDNSSTLANTKLRLYIGNGSEATPGHSNDHFVLQGDGNVGIGTSSPDAKLAVKGTIHTQEVKVDLLGAMVPDYVFESNYQLPPLESVKTYIDENKHLPEVPSAKEMETNGMNVGEMNLLLLKKIEELTLYQIETTRKIEQLELEIQQLKTVKN